MNKTLVISTIAGVLLVFALVGLFLWQTERNQVSPTVSPAPPAQTPPPLAPSPQSPAEVLDTSDWQTYRNDEFGFEVKYPPNFAVGICGWASADMQKPIAIGFDDAKLVNQGSVGCDIGLESYGIIFDFEMGSYVSREDAVRSFPLGTNDSLGPVEYINFNHYEFAKVQRFDSQALSDTFYVIQYPESNLFLSVDASPYNSVSPQTHETLDYNEIAGQMLATFRFVE